MAKANKADMVRRERLIQELMSQGLDRNTIFRTVAEKENIAESSVCRQYYAIVSDMQKLVKDQRDELRANLMARQDAIYQRAISANNLKTALDATSAQAKLGGLYESEISSPKQPEAIIFKEKDFSNPLQVVPKKAENE